MIAARVSSAACAASAAAVIASALSGASSGASPSSSPRPVSAGSAERESILLAWCTTASTSLSFSYGISASACAIHSLWRSSSSGSLLFGSGPPAGALSADASVGGSSWPSIARKKATRGLRLEECSV